ncbi:synaptophysin-like isoform X2 [Oratosquilla oratoria]|uniref:synaptophysin-like isoform X2 n=1 Tax=Oratosquilla oratoria TaxID=337810 RepID=UPI003F75DC28
MEMVQALMSNMNMRVLKEPRGFMKILQFIFSICAFGTTTSFSTILAIKRADCANSPVKAEIHYNFQLDEIIFKPCHDGNKSDFSLPGDFSSDSGFFVAVGVLAFLYALAALGLYVFLGPLYENDAKFPVMDCCAHIIFAIFWLAGSSAWANSLNGLKTAVTIDSVIEQNDSCHDHPCTLTDTPNFAKLNISIILGFLNVFLWGSNLWFLYKETPFFKKEQQEQQPEGGMQN